MPTSASFNVSSTQAFFNVLHATAVLIGRESCLFKSVVTIVTVSSPPSLFSVALQIHELLAEGRGLAGHKQLASLLEGFLILLAEQVVDLVLEVFVRRVSSFVLLLP